MQELRYILVALGGFAIAGLLIHGLWMGRKQRQQITPLKDRPARRSGTRATPEMLDGIDDAERFDADGVGKVRVVTPGVAASRSEKSVAPRFVEQSEVKPLANDDLKPLLQDEPEFVLFDELEPVAAPVEPPVEPQMPQSTVQDHLSPLDETPMVEEPTPKPRVEVVSEPVAPTVKKETFVPPIWQEVYVLNVMARPHQLIAGSALKAALESNGFFFGDMSIYHYHEQMSGSGSVLFSAANIVNPGTFDPYRMEHFTTPGICIFMQLPGPRHNAALVYEDMLAAADQIASDLDAILADQDRKPLTDLAIEQARRELAAFESSRI